MTESAMFGSRAAPPRRSGRRPRLPGQSGSAPALPGRLRALLAALLLAPLAFASEARGQATEGDPRLLPLEATPVGALPPIALPMPASRNHNYWGFRVQAGQRTGREGSDLRALAAGVDFQWRGGSAFGVTAGYQEGECGAAVTECDGHFLFGTRARLNFITGGPTLAGLLGDETATTTLGTEVGLGYAPDVARGVDACTADLGVPVSIAMFQRIRMVAYASPALALDVDCSGGDYPTRLSFLTGVGVGVLQLGHRGLDVFLGLQNIFRSGTGYHFGITATYVHIP